MGKKFLKNKFKYIFFIINFLIIFITLTVFLIFFRENNSENIIKNVVKIEKKGQIIKNNKNPENILNKNLETKIIISNGFFIEKDLILTTAHSVGEKSDIYEIQTFNGKKFKAKLLKKDLEKDIAFLQIKEDFLDFQNVKISKNLKKGQNIISYYFSQNSEKIETQSGKILEISSENIISDLQLKKGNSGSPIFDENLNFIGINKEFNILQKETISQKIQKYN